jgi:hypothetical protein
MHRASETSSSKPNLVGWAVVLLSGAVCWVLFVGGLHRNEMLVGGLVLVFTIAFLLQVRRIETVHTEFRLADLIQAWRIPWYVLSGVYEIVAILIKDLLHIKPAASFYRVSGFKTSKSDPLQIVRRVLATFYTTMAPNFIVIGIDVSQSRMLFHQLQRSSVPRMTKALGAQPGASRS